MPPLKWSQTATVDLDRLHQFLAIKSPKVAQRAIQCIRKGVRNLHTNPELGRAVEDTPAGFRQWFVPFGKSGYVVLYHYNGEEIVLLPVHHGREQAL